MENVAAPDTFFEICKLFNLFSKGLNEPSQTFNRNPMHCDKQPDGLK